MRKILVSVVSVAGLLAVVLALATSPASAERSVVTIDTGAADGDADVPAGVYTVSWETIGGCNPGAQTSGSSGSVSLTVTADNEVNDPAAPVVLELEGDPERDFVTVNDDCSYEWSGGFADAATNAQCQLVSGGAGIPDPDADEATADTPANIALTIAEVGGTSACAPGGQIVVTVTDGTFVRGPQTAGADTADVTEDDVFADDKDDGVTGGAIEETTFTVTAVPVANSKVVCQGVAAETEVNDLSATVAKLNVVGNEAVLDGELTPVNCRYNVEVELPDGFKATSIGSNKARRQSAVDVAATDGVAENAFAPKVNVAVRNVYLIQTVIGDANGGTASYWLGWPPPEGPSKDPRCVPGLPGDLRRQIGITSETFVNLRSGTFNINAAITSNADGIAANALDKKAVQCYAVTYVSNLPDHCEAENPTNGASSNLATDADDDGNVRVDMVITCSDPADDAADDMGGADDMDDAADDIDDGADDIDDGADDMDDMDDGADDMDDAVDRTVLTAAETKAACEGQGLPDDYVGPPAVCITG